MENIWIFIGALVAVYLTPGPDMLLVIQTSIVLNKSHALATAVGLGVARAAHVMLAALGFATLLQSTPWALDVVRTLGALYLIWLGANIATAPSAYSVAAVPSSPPVSRRYSSAALRGLMTNVLNPKALLFCSVLLPQFVSEDSLSPAKQFFMLGAVLLLLGLLFDVMYSFLGASLRASIAKRPQVESLQRWVFSGALILFGVWLAFTG